MSFVVDYSRGTAVLRPASEVPKAFLDTYNQIDWNSGVGKLKQKPTASPTPFAAAGEDDVGRYTLGGGRYQRTMDALMAQPLDAATKPIDAMTNVLYAMGNNGADDAFDQRRSYSRAVAKWCDANASSVPPAAQPFVDWLKAGLKSKKAAKIDFDSFDASIDHLIDAMVQAAARAKRLPLQ
jgi:hypothetical protein